MTGAAHEPGKHVPRGQGAAKPFASVFLISFLAAVAATAAAFGLGGTLGVGVGAAIGLVGAGICAAIAAQAASAPAGKVAALLDIALSDQAPNEPPTAFRTEPWLSLYREVASSAAAQRASAMALLELEKFRRESEGPPVDATYHEPRPSFGAGELIGPDGTASPDAADPDEYGPQAAEALRSCEAGLASIETDLGDLLHALQSAPAPGTNGTNGTPAAMVDTLVRTAADGIEDLAAGLMRANELAGVAEKVTNRATLLALNAALEATRSGSEAFASIAEETRRLAEFAREATDTISRLSSEIEFKVGETIASIRSSSEDAKAAVASIGAATIAGSTPVSPATLEALESLRTRTRALRERLDASMAAPGPASLPETVEDEAPIAYGEDVPSVAYEEDAPPAAYDEDSPPVAYGEDVPSVGDSFVEEPATDPTADYETGPPNDPFEPVVPTELADHAEPRAIDPTSAGDSAPDAREPAAPAVEPKIPDWLEGIQPGGPR